MGLVPQWEQTGRCAAGNRQRTADSGGCRATGPGPAVESGNRRPARRGRSWRHPTFRPRGGGCARDAGFFGRDEDIAEGQGISAGREAGSHEGRRCREGRGARSSGAPCRFAACTSHGASPGRRRRGAARRRSRRLARGAANDGTLVSRRRARPGGCACCDGGVTGTREAFHTRAPAHTAARTLAGADRRASNAGRRRRHASSARGPARRAP